MAGRHMKGKKYVRMYGGKTVTLHKATITLVVVHAPRTPRVRKLDLTDGLLDWTRPARSGSRNAKLRSGFARCMFHARDLLLEPGGKVLIS